MTSQPASTFPAMASHGNPAAVPSISCHTCARTFARARAIRSRVRGSASSSVRRTVVSDGAAPSTRSRWPSTAMSRMLVAPSAIATAIDTSATPRSSSGDLPARASAGPSSAVSPHWSASLRSSTAPACPIRPSPSAVTDRLWSQRVSFGIEERSSLGFTTVWYRVISQNRALFAAYSR